ncbi:MAG: PAS domain S-box protein, partial [Candidatus Magasanikbacteria bacterium]|nr:PAS domain S-box protein [Candidatus Magasanikbacteria bacterium]
TGEMTWVLGGAPGSDKLIESEAKLNRFFPKNDCVALCQYDRNFFSPEILTGVIHTHPTVVVGGVMCKNFYYIPVDEFLKSGMNSSEEVDRLLKNLIDRERMESEIRSIEEKYRRIVTSANQGVWIIDRDFKITFVNPRICEMMGYAEQELLGHRIDEFISSEELIDNAKKMKEGHSEKMDTYDRRCMRKDGEMIWVTISATPLFDSKNVFEGALNMITDITQRKQIENELRESEEKFSAAFTASPDAIVITRLKDGVIVEINEAFTKLFGFTRKQARGVSAVDLSIWVDTKDRSVFIDTLVKEKEIDNWEVQLRRKDGSIITVIDSARVISFQNVDCVLSVIRDISDRKRTEMELASLNRFLRMVSDVNQTLIRATEEMSLLVGTCRIVVEEGGYRLAWVGMMEYDEEKTVKPVALAGFGAEYTKRANISWADNEQGRGPTGTAIRTGKTVISIDIARDPRMVPWQASAAEFGYKSSIALPWLLVLLRCVDEIFN